MSKYIKAIPLSRIERIQVWPNPKGLTLAEAMEAQGVEPDIGMSGVYYNGNWTIAGHVKVDGVTLNTEPWGDWAYAWDDGPDMRMIQIPPGGGAGQRNYITCKPLLTPWDGIDAPLEVGTALKGSRGWAAWALDGKHLILWATSDGADGITLPALRDELYHMGAETALALDGGQSVKLRTKGGGVYINNPSRTVTQHYIFIWLQPEDEEDKPMGKTVCLDPGHGPGCANGSPDGAYKEHEFAWDMGQRVKIHLERCGVRVVMTRGEAGYPSLAERCSISNKAGVDLFVSLHSNAGGDGKGWTSPSGLIVYTSAGPESAARNVAARAVLEQMKAAGIAISGGGLLHNPAYAVLKGTTAPAMIVEYGFHTNKADVALLRDSDHRDKLAEATAKGVCEFLGVAWTDGASGMPRPTEWYAEARDWAMALGLTDGTRPLEGCTRAEQWTIAYRLYQAIKAGK